MSVAIMAEVFKHSRSTLGSRLVLLAIADNCNDDTRSGWPSVPTLSRKARISERAVQYALRDLEDIGELVTETRTNSSSLYRIAHLPTGAISAPVKEVTPGGAESAPVVVHVASPDVVKPVAPRTIIGNHQLEPSKNRRAVSVQNQEEFEHFWSLYPKKRGKGDAQKAWRAMNGTRPSPEVLSAAIGWQRKQPDWMKDGGQYIPFPATWLRGRRWEDERTEVQAACTMPKTAANASAIESWLGKKEMENEERGCGQVREINDDSRRYIR